MILLKDSFTDKMIYASYLRGDFQESKCQIGFVNYHQFYGDFTLTYRKEIAN